MKLNALICCLMVSATPALGASGPVLQFPDGAVRAYSEARPLASLQLPVGPYRNGTITTEPVEGALVREVWKTSPGDIATIALLKPLRERLTSEGFKIIFECETRDCGGFDFRFNPAILDEPDMHVDLGDYRYLAAVRDTDKGEEYISLVVSRSSERGFVQVTHVSEGTVDEPRITVSTKQSPSDEIAIPADSIGDMLLKNGSVVLDGLVFAKGSAKLDGKPSASLRELAEFLNRNPGMTVALVGHTDASGSMKRNVVLSQERAAAVMARLVETYGVDPKQVSAEGVGFLAPRAPNTTPKGREMNRRVEVVLVSIK